MNKEKPAKTHRRTLLVQPNREWPPLARSLSMRSWVSENLEHARFKLFTFEKTPLYEAQQKKFEAVQQTNDIRFLIQFLQSNPYHHETLLYLSDFLRMQGQFQQANELVEKCVYAFEDSWIREFQPIGDTPQTRMDLLEDNLNRVFGESLVRLIDILGRKGCARTALELCKLVLSLSPQNDMFGNLLRIDYYAIRSGELGFLMRFVEEFVGEFYGNEVQPTILLLPNLIYSTSLTQ